MHWIGAQFSVKILSERSEEDKEQKEHKGSVLVAQSGYNAQNAQFGLVMFLLKLWKKRCAIISTCYS